MNGRAHPASLDRWSRGSALGAPGHPSEPNAAGVVDTIATLVSARRGSSTTEEVALGLTPQMRRNQPPTLWSLSLQGGNPNVGRRVEQRAAYAFPRQYRSGPARRDR